MEKYDEDFFERLSDKTIGNLDLEKPSLGFSSKVMGQIRTQVEDKSLYVYKPLISKKVWAFIALGIVALVIYVFKENIYWEVIPEKLSAFNFTPRLSDLNFKITMPNLPYLLILGICTLAFMTLIEIPLIKRLSEKKQ